MPRTDRRPSPPGRTVQAGDLRVHVEERGQGGPGFLLLHGYLASTTIWHPVMDGLARHGRTVAVDLPGAGYSDRPAQAPYDPTWLAGCLPAILDALDLHQPILVAHSLGGAVALRALAMRPDLARGLVLISPLVYRPAPPPGLRLAKRYPGPARLFFQSPIGRKLVASLVRRAVYGAGNSRAQARRRAARMLAHLDAPGGWEAATRMGLSATAGAMDEAELAAITHPCLVFWGGCDRAHPVWLGPRLCRDLGGRAKLVVFPHAAHNCHEEEPQAFCLAVARWADAEGLLTGAGI